MSKLTHIKVKTEDEMILQLKLLLNNGYAAAIRKYVNELNLASDDVTYDIAYCENPKG